MRLAKISVGLFRPWAALTVVAAIAAIEFSVAEPLPPWHEFVFSLTGVALVASAGFTLNDYFDRDLDIQVHPGRLIPSGLARPRDVLQIGVLCALLGLLALAFAGLVNVVIGAGIIFLLVLYSPAKNLFGLLGNIVISAVLAASIGYAYVTTENESPEYVIAMFILAMFAVSLGQEALKDVEDMEGERSYRRTLPHLLGVRGVYLYSALCLGAAQAGMLALVILRADGYQLVLAAPVIAYGWFVIWSLARGKSEAVATRLVVLLKIGMTAMLALVPVVA